MGKPLIIEAPPHPQGKDDPRKPFSHITIRRISLLKPPCLIHLGTPTEEDYQNGYEVTKVRKGEPKKVLAPCEFPYAEATTSYTHRETFYGKDYLPRGFHTSVRQLRPAIVVVRKNSIR